MLTSRVNQACAVFDTNYVRFDPLAGEENRHRVSSEEDTQQRAPFKVSSVNYTDSRFEKSTGNSIQLGTHTKRNFYLSECKYRVQVNTCSQFRTKASVTGTQFLRNCVYGRSWLLKPNVAKCNGVLPFN
ncbi:hypothetical protein CAPTEDRAFT_198556 [Capitella teleta]|uniref:Uncharacterized protein n=1 Tax=Capitella teleta TaxID=283909 RepID=R7TYM0_CAPTE|nr:hypothetical protein CAPTEDRAFT_198556 [Capitella teleta]|eukprot:ELT98727.1 hypothetical protein CAPTEDRAFT_198556 [Capitella teleta]